MLRIFVVMVSPPMGVGVGMGLEGMLNAALCRSLPFVRFRCGWHCYAHGHNCGSAQVPRGNCNSIYHKIPQTCPGILAYCHPDSCNCTIFVFILMSKLCACSLFICSLAIGTRTAPTANADKMNERLHSIRINFQWLHITNCWYNKISVALTATHTLSATPNAR